MAMIRAGLLPGALNRPDQISMVATCCILWKNNKSSALKTMKNHARNAVRAYRDVRLLIRRGPVFCYGRNHIIKGKKPMSPKPVFCFIDDAKFELENFEKNAAPAFEGVDFVYASTFEQARTQMNGRMPVCFLLDIYGADPAMKKPVLPAPEVFSQVLENTPNLDGLYEGHGQEGELTPEAGNAFLRDLYAQVEAWQTAFGQACQGLGQGNAYGLANLALARAQYPWAAALGFSRKALYEDAAAMTAAGADGVLRKPQGADEAAIAGATKKAAPDLARVAFAAVDRRLAGRASALGLMLYQDGHNLPLAEAILRGVRQMDSSLVGDPKCSHAQAAETLAELRLEDVGLSQEALGLLIAFKRWLGR
jgi:hypothetical protein